MADPWAEVNERWQAWESLQLPLRKYSLLVAGWISLVDQRLDQLWRGRRRGIDALLQSADGRLSPAQRADVREWADRRIARLAEGRDREWPAEQPVPYEFLLPQRAETEITVTHQLRSALDDPITVAREIIAESATWHGYKRPEGLLSVMECLNRLEWCPVDGWVPPATARRWARQVYDERDFSSFPILADLLEDAGCPDQVMLDHCRTSTAHVRGCAVIEWLLGAPSAVRPPGRTNSWSSTR